MLSRAAHYAIAGIVRLAAVPEGGFCRVDDLVAGTRAPKFAVGKVLHRLARAGLLESVQGAKGGYRLQPGCLDRTLLQVIEATDGPLQNSACIDRGLCEPGSDCPLELTLEPAVEALRRVLSQTRVEDLVKLDPRKTCCSSHPSDCMEKRSVSTSKLASRGGPSWE